MTRSRGIVAEVDGDSRFDALFERHHADVLRYCVRRLGMADGEDAAADVFSVAWRRLDEMPEHAERAWLFGVAYRVVGNQYRSRSRRGRLLDRLVDQTPNEIEAGDDEDVIALLAALARLRPIDRELLKMVAWDGLSRSEIAAVLRIKENAVDQRIFRARKRLRASLGKSNPTVSERLEA